MTLPSASIGAATALPGEAKELQAEGMPMNRKTVAESMRRLGVAPNLLDQDFSAQRPDQKWAGDITYLRTTQGWLYLAVVIDLCTDGVIMHTDRGSVYCGWQHRDLIRRHRLIASMSGRGNCYENAPVESFFHTLKVESIHGEPLVDRATLRRQLFEYIEIDYNRTRRHSALG